MDDARPDVRNALSVGTIVGEYKVEGLLGDGGFSIVYQARHIELERVVALKEYFPREDAVRDGKTVYPRSTESTLRYEDGRRRFLEEARRIVEFKDDPGVVECLGFFRANGTAYMVLEHVEGLPLADLLRRREAVGKPLDESELRSIVLPLLTTLSRLHKADVLHRDIKPQNILIRRSDHQPLLIDFGAAKQEATLHSKSAAPFTDGYAAMEQVSEDGELGPWTDIYAIGAVMWRVVAGGKPPWEPLIPKKVEDRAFAVLSGKPDPLPSAAELGEDRFSSSLLVTIDTCLKIHETERVRDCDDLTKLIKSSWPLGPRGNFVEIRILPEEPRWAKAHEWLRELAVAPNVANETTIREYKKMTHGMTSDQKELLSLNILLDYCYEDYKRKADIPLFGSREEFVKECRRLQAEARKPENKIVRDRVATRRIRVRKLTQRMVSHGLIAKESLDRRNYITHQVFQYAKRSKRLGTTPSINMNLLEAESQWMTRTLTDISIALTIKKFQESEYNFRRDMIIAIDENNRKEMNRLIVAEFCNLKKELGRAKVDLSRVADPFMAAREFMIMEHKRLQTSGNSTLEVETIMREKYYKKVPKFLRLWAFGLKLRRYFGEIQAVISEDYPDVTEEFRNDIRILTKDVYGAHITGEQRRTLGWLASGALLREYPHLQKSASAALAVVTMRRSYLRHELDNWIEPQNIGTALKKLATLGDDRFAGMVAWQPDNANILFTESALPERQVRKIKDRVQEIVDAVPETKPLLDRQLLEEIENALTPQTIMSSQKYQMVLHKELAATLNAFRDEYLSNQFDHRVPSFWNKFVRWFANRI